MSALIPAYAQARWSAFPTVQWCVINDVVRHAHVDVVATAMAAREPWGSLLTRCVRQLCACTPYESPRCLLLSSACSHQKRFTGYKFGRAPWSNIVTLQTQDELWGSRARHWRRYHQPVVMEEDRYEMNKLAGVVDDSIAWYREVCEPRSSPARVVVTTARRVAVAVHVEQHCQRSASNVRRHQVRTR
jgi:hypothetical protein